MTSYDRITCMLLLQLGSGESQMLDKPLYEGVKRCMACFHFPLCFEDNRGGGPPDHSTLLSSELSS